MSHEGLKLRLDTICLSIYSFGYGAGFLVDARYPNRSIPITLATTCDVAVQHGLGGVEVPIDRLAPSGSKQDIVAIIEYVSARGLLLRLDMETFSLPYLRGLIPLAAERGLGFVRVKVSDFYGGNRYRHPEFAADFDRLCTGLEALMPTLESTGVRVLIENHQDIMLADYDELWRRFGRKAIGVNWDTGNSLPACETPETFLARTRDVIGNVHLKDYRIFAAPTGYRMSRCALGAGIIDFPSLLQSLLSEAPATPMTIELGALNARTADIGLNEYWRAIPGKSAADVDAFRHFIEARITEGGEWRSAWERREAPEAILSSELAELSESVHYLAGI